jgi:signal peptidase I
VAHAGERLSVAWRKTFIGELAEVAIIAIILFMVARIAVQNFRVNGLSMEPSLQNNEFILVDKVTYHFSPPHRGDIIVFKYPYKNVDFIKRIIGLPGDRVSIHGSYVYVNGKRMSEGYIKAKPDYTMTTIPNQTSNVVPSGEYFVLGDNRNNSDDSHLWGLLPRQNIIGRALISYWPPQDFGFLGASSSKTVAAGTH